jgi:hypothetical protein
VPVKALISYFFLVLPVEYLKTHHPEDPELLEQYREASGRAAFAGFYRRTITGRSSPAGIR